MPGVMPAELAERLSDQDDLPIESFKEQARDELIEKLVCGKTVHRFNCRDVFDSALNRDTQYHDCLEILEGLVALTEKCGDNFLLDARALAEKAKGFVERFVDAHEDWIEEKAADLASEEDL